MCILESNIKNAENKTSKILWVIFRNNKKWILSKTRSQNHAWKFHEYYTKVTFENDTKFDTFICWKPKQSSSEIITMLNYSKYSCIVQLLTHVINIYLSHRVFRNSSKEAEVIQSIKKYSHSLSSYRPIAIFPDLSKVIESLLVREFTKFIRKLEVLCNGQHKF